MDNLKVLQLPYSDNYMQNRVNRFYEEFLTNEQSHEHIEQLLATIHDYLLLCDAGESIELTQSIINLRQSIYWVQTWNSEDFDMQE